MARDNNPQRQGDLSSNNPTSDQPTSPNATNTQQKTNKDKTIGQYQLGKSIGEGTFGKVKLGTHILTGEKVTTKVLFYDFCIGSSQNTRKRQNR